MYGRNSHRSDDISHRLGLLAGTARAAAAGEESKEENSSQARREKWQKNVVGALGSRKSNLGLVEGGKDSGGCGFLPSSHPQPNMMCAGFQICFS